MVYNINSTAVEWLIFVPQKHDETSELLYEAKARTTANGLQGLP